MQLPKNHLKHQLLEDKPLIGLWSTIGSNIVAEIVADSGFDWILLDTEHSPNEIPDLIAQMQALATGTASAIVRPAWNDPVLIKRLLDAGVPNLLIPFVQNGEEAKAAVSATRYPPEGIRGVSGSSRASRYGRVKSYLHEAASEIGVIVQVETAVALKNITEIATVPGVDGVFIGPSDLSTSMGHLGNPNHEEVQAAIKTAVDTLNSLGKPCGILAHNPNDARRYIEWGVRFISVGSDNGLLAQHADALAASFKISPDD